MGDDGGDVALEARLTPRTARHGVSASGAPLNLRGLRRGAALEQIGDKRVGSCAATGLPPPRSAPRAPRFFDHAAIPTDCHLRLRGRDHPPGHLVHLGDRGPNQQGEQRERDHAQGRARCAPFQARPSRPRPQSSAGRSRHGSAPERPWRAPSPGVSSRAWHHRACRTACAASSREHQAALSISPGAGHRRPGPWARRRRSAGVPHDDAVDQIEQRRLRW